MSVDNSNNKKWLVAPISKNNDMQILFSQVINKLEEDPSVQLIKVISKKILCFAVIKTDQVTVDNLKKVFGNQVDISLDESLDQFHL